MDFARILDKIPDYKQYLTFEELEGNSSRLAEEHPETVKILEAGKSAAGKPIRCIKIGNGNHNALIYGYPNPEEPLGGMLIDYFTSALASDSDMVKLLGYTWYFIKCIDPDGAELTKGFLKGPLTPLNFARNYYRTPESLTGEENFPYRNGKVNFNNPRPETEALMNILDRVSFDFISTLHNMKWGGITYQVPAACPQLYGPLQDIAKTYNIFLRKRLGTMLAPGIQYAGYLTPARNLARARLTGKTPLQEITGAFTFEYAQLSNPDVFMMIPECSLWYDPRCYNDEPSENTWAEVNQSTSRIDTETNSYLRSLFERAEPSLRTESTFLTMMRPIINEIKSPTINILDPGPEVADQQLKRLATVAEKVETEGRADIYRLFNLGTMIRMIDFETHVNNDPTLLSCKKDAVDKLEEWNRQLHEKYSCKAHAIHNLLAMNLGSLLYSAEYAKRNKSIAS